MTRRPLTAVTPLLRAVVLGGGVAGLVGALVGLVVGLATYAPTAWAATVEIGLPAALLGALLGLAWGVVRRRPHAG